MEYRFWDTQPMMKRGAAEEGEEPGEIETKSVNDVRKEPYNMAAGFEWCHVDVMDEKEAEVRQAELWIRLSGLNPAELS